MKTDDETPIYDRLIEEVGELPEPPEDLVTQEIRDLEQMNELLKNVRSSNEAIPYRPNRADRRAASKQARRARRKARG